MHQRCSPTMHHILFKPSILTNRHTQCVNTTNEQLHTHSYDLHQVAGGSQIIARIDESSLFPGLVRVPLLPLNSRKIIFPILWMIVGKGEKRSGERKYQSAIKRPGEIKFELVYIYAFFSLIPFLTYLYLLFKKVSVHYPPSVVVLKGSRTLEGFRDDNNDDI